MPDPPISISGHLDWLKANLPCFRWGKIGIIFTVRDGVIVRGERVYLESFKTQEPGISLDKTFPDELE